jgi:hypothetical protein
MATFIGLVAFGEYLSITSGFESNQYYTSGDGAQVEGVVASFLLDLFDTPTDGGEDIVSLPASYLGMVTRTCSVHFPYPLMTFPAFSTDHFVYCLEDQLDPAVVNSTWYFAGAPDPVSYSVSAAKPGSWSLSANRATWTRNLYPVGAPPPPPPPSISVGLTGPSLVLPGAQCTWLVAASGGDGNYTYEWSVDQTAYPGYTTTFPYQNGGASFSVSVLVRDGGGLTGSNSMQVTASGSASECLDQ